MLVRCLYASRAVKPSGPGVLDGILEQSRRNNPARGITGLLCSSGGIYVQLLEGGRNQVSGLFSAISRDARHEGVTLLAYQEIAERHFGCWSMGQVNTETVNSAVLLKYSEKAELDPFSATGEATLALMLELSASGSIVSRGSLKS